MAIAANGIRCVPRCRECDLVSGVSHDLLQQLVVNHVDLSDGRRSKHLRIETPFSENVAACFADPQRNVRFGMLIARRKIQGRECRLQAYFVAGALRPFQLLTQLRKWQVLMTSCIGQSLVRRRQEAAERDARFQGAAEWQAVRRFSGGGLQFSAFLTIELIADQQIGLVAEAMKCQLACGEQNVRHWQIQFS